MNARTTTLTGQQSMIIDFFRFPLIFLVVLHHANIKVANPFANDIQLFSGDFYYNISAIFFANILTYFAVGLFFFISGFLFFLNVSSFTSDIYKSKIKRRFRTLFIPYLLWNIIFYTVLSIYEARAVNLTELLNWHILYDYNYIGSRTDWAGNVIDNYAPFVVPLWFVRDLFITCLFSPVIYFFIKKYRAITLTFMAFIVASRFWIHLPGFSPESLAAFAFGATFSIHRIDIIEFSKKYITPLSLSFVAALTISIFAFNINTIIAQNCFYISGALLILIGIHIADRLVTKHKCKIPAVLSANVFFIMAMHVAPLPKIYSLMYVSQKIAGYLNPFHNWLGDFINMIMIPSIDIAICIALITLLKRILPGLSVLLVGKR